MATFSSWVIMMATCVSSPVGRRSVFAPATPWQCIMGAARVPSTEDWNRLFQASKLISREVTGPAVLNCCLISEVDRHDDCVLHPLGDSLELLCVRASPRCGVSYNTFFFVSHMLLKIVFFYCLNKTNINKTKHLQEKCDEVSFELLLPELLHCFRPLFVFLSKTNRLVFSCIFFSCCK